MIYHANGGFNWYDLYYMPTKLREFYWRELLKVKESETTQYEKQSAKSTAANSRVRRK